MKLFAKEIDNKLKGVPRYELELQSKGKWSYGIWVYFDEEGRMMSPKSGMVHWLVKECFP